MASNATTTKAFEKAKPVISTRPPSVASPAIAPQTSAIELPYIPEDPKKRTYAQWVARETNRKTAGGAWMKRLRNFALSPLERSTDELRSLVREHFLSFFEYRCAVDVNFDDDTPMPEHYASNETRALWDLLRLPCDGWDRMNLAAYLSLLGERYDWWACTRPKGGRDETAVHALMRGMSDSPRSPDSDGDKFAAIRELSRRISDLLRELPEGAFDRIEINKVSVAHTYQDAMVEPVNGKHDWAQTFDGLSIAMREQQHRMHYLMRDLETLSDRAKHLGNGALVVSTHKRSFEPLMWTACEVYSATDDLVDQLEQINQQIDEHAEKIEKEMPNRAFKRLALVPVVVPFNPSTGLGPDTTFEAVTVPVVGKTAD